MGGILAWDIVHAEFDQTYAFMDVDVDTLDSGGRTAVLPVHTFFFQFTLIPFQVGWCLFQPLPTSSSSTKNIFDDLPALSAPPKSDLHDELDCYLSTDPEHVTDALAWWYEKRLIYPHLHLMALDYLTIPGKLQLC